MTVLSRVLGTLMLAACVSTIAPARPSAQTQAPPQAQTQAPRETTAARDEFVPIAELPEGEKLAAGPLLVAAYSVAWAAILSYLWMLWRRLGKVEQELAAARRSTASR